MAEACRRGGVAYSAEAEAYPAAPNGGGGAIVGKAAAIAAYATGIATAALRATASGVRVGAVVVAAGRRGRGEVLIGRRLPRAGGSGGRDRG